jgi:PAS domain S-box-containing protein
MDYKKRYTDIFKINQQLKEELDSIRSKAEGKNDLIKEMIFKSFHSSSQLMSICKIDSGEYVDVNNIFLGTLGYTRDEIIGRISDDIQILSDAEVILKTKSGELLPFHSSSETIQFGDDVYLLTIYNSTDSSKDKTIKDIERTMLEEIFETVSSYLALFSTSEDKNIYIIDLNHKAEEIEFIRKSEVIGKCINDTPLINRVKLVELLHHIRITGDPHKLSVSQVGDDSEGYYMGFPLTSGNIVITWEPGYLQKNRDDLLMQGLAFEKFAEMFPEMIYEIDLQGKITFANIQVLNFFGYTKEDVKNGLLISGIFPESSETMIDNLSTLQFQGQTSNNEYLLKKKNGTIVPILAHSFAIFHDDKIIGYRGVLTDISKSKEYENQIIREKTFLEHLIDSTPEAIAITESRGKITMVNKEFTNLFGYTSGESVNRFINDLVVPEDRKEEAVTIDNLASSNYQEIRQTIRKDKYGNKIHVYLIAKAIVLNNEIVAFLGIYRDITTEKKNQLLQEILFNISNAALKQFELKDLYPIIVQEIGKIWDTNNFYIAIYDKTSESLSLPFFSDEKDNFQEIPAKKTITGWVINHKKSVLLKENDLKILEEAGEVELVGTQCKVWMGVPLTVEGETIGVMCLQDYNAEDKFSSEDLNVLDFIATQIAVAIQRRTMLDNLILARQKAEEAAQSRQTFMSTMSHEIRTPLSEVIGIANLLLQGNPREDQMDFIKTLRFSGNHLLTLVNDVLDYNKMELGKIVFEQIQFNLTDFLNEIKRSYSFKAKEKKLEFDIIMEPDLPIEVIGDSIRLNQILSNLLSNAMKFTTRGSISVKVRELERTGNQSKMEFIIKDTGIGIPKDKHTLIFESYTQASPDTTRRYGGTGLGLAICKKLIELQGGTITVESEQDKGSIFRFTIPFTVLEKQIHNLGSDSEETFEGLKGKRILVAEDNKINFFVANKFLTGWGMKVTHAENGKIALDILKKEEFDLILMDLHMPVLDGIEASKIIKNSDNPKIKNIPIVALTAAMMSESHDKIEDLYIDDIILKPFKPKDLYDRILKHIK